MILPSLASSRRPALPALRSNLAHQLQIACLAVIAALTMSVATGSTVHTVSASDPTLPQPNGGNGESGAPCITPDGRFVLFASTANNLKTTGNAPSVSTSFPAPFNVFLKDRSSGTTTLVTVDPAGICSGNGDSVPVSISTDGRYACFESSAGNLVANDTNNAGDIFIRDLQNGSTILVSVNTNGWSANGESRGAVMTPDARVVAFISLGTDLTPGDTNGVPDIYVRNLETGTTELASRDLAANRGFQTPDISEDGRVVAFCSGSSQGPTAVSGNVYVRDLESQKTTLAGTNADQILQEATGYSGAISFNPCLAADGNSIVFAVKNPAPAFSSALLLRHDLVTGITDLVHTNAVMFSSLGEAEPVGVSRDGRYVAFIGSTGSQNYPAVLRWDSQLKTSELVNVDLTNGIPQGTDYNWPLISPNGRHVCFTTSAQNLVTNKISEGPHIYLRDLEAIKTVLVDTGTNHEGFGVVSCGRPALEPTGRFVAFEAFDPSGSNVVHLNSQVYVRDLESAAAELVSSRNPELSRLTANEGSTFETPSVSRNGRYIAFTSFASDLAPNDTNRQRDVFVRDLRTGRTTLASVAKTGASANGASFEPSISPDGRYVAFSSMADDLVTGDTNGKLDVFVFEMETGEVTLASATPTGVPGNNSSYAPRIDVTSKGLFFYSRASNLTTLSTTAGAENFFYRDLIAGTNLALTTSGRTSEAISADGRYAAYVSGYGNYIWDSLTRTNTKQWRYHEVMFAISPTGDHIASSRLSSSQVLSIRQTSSYEEWSVTVPGIASSITPSSNSKITFSSDGEYLLFASSSRAGLQDTNNISDILVHHIRSRTTTAISRSTNGVSAANGASDFPDISYDGRFIVYRSAATDLVPGDMNGTKDLFVYDRSTGTTRMLNVGESSTPGNGPIFAPVFSGDGRTLVFPSAASNLSPGDSNLAIDMFAYTFLYVEITKTEAGTVLTWPATPGQVYQVQFKSSAGPSDWQNLSGSYDISQGIARLVDTASSEPNRLYRVVAH